MKYYRCSAAGACKPTWPCDNKLIHEGDWGGDDCTMVHKHVKDIHVASDGKVLWSDGGLYLVRVSEPIHGLKAGDRVTVVRGDI